MADEYATLHGRVENMTGSAILFHIDDLDEDVWFPLSVIRFSDPSLDILYQTEMLVPLWIAKEKGIV